MYYLVADSDTSTVKREFDTIDGVLYWYNKFVALKANCVMIWFSVGMSYSFDPVLLEYHINEENCNELG